MAGSEASADDLSPPELGVAVPVPSPARGPDDSVFGGDGEPNRPGEVLRGRTGSTIDDLLFEIYDRWHDSQRDSLDSDTFTEYSSAAEVPGYWRADIFPEGGDHRSEQLHRAFLEGQDVEQLENMLSNLKYSISQMSTRLVRQLKRRDHRLAKLRCNYDIVTAILQASSLKRQIDTRMRFSLEPPPAENTFLQWKDAMKGVARLPLGIPDEFRKKVWLSLADCYMKEVCVDWEKTVRFTFNDRCNPDDNKLGMQIVKDLHRTGCSSFSGQDNEEDRAVLKRVLLAYARWNKQIGYCQGFNVIAALLLDVTDRIEADALKVMIYLIDKVLPQSYFANNLRALSVDMAVFRDLLHWKFPTLSRHLDHLQSAARDEASGAVYEPPLTNVFTMQWFLTLFATCLPKKTVLRVWDSILLEGSEILLRAALVIWGRLAKRILTASSADDFYSLMGELTQEMVNSNMFGADRMIKAVYSVAPFPFPQLTELREKYTYNIRPFTGSVSSGKKVHKVDNGILASDDDDELDDDDIEAIRCFAGLFPVQSLGGRTKTSDLDPNGCSSSDISSVGPGVYGSGSDSTSVGNRNSAYMERMTTDLSALRKQYKKLRERQAQAHIILTAACSQQQNDLEIIGISPEIKSPKAMNHLFIGKDGTMHKHKNRFVAEAPMIASLYPKKTAMKQQLYIQSKLPYILNQQESFKVHNSKPGAKKKMPSEVDAKRPEMCSETDSEREETKSVFSNECAGFEIMQHCKEVPLQKKIHQPNHKEQSLELSDVSEDALSPVGSDFTGSTVSLSEISGSASSDHATRHQFNSGMDSESKQELLGLKRERTQLLGDLAVRKTSMEHTDHNTAVIGAKFQKHKVSCLNQARQFAHKANPICRLSPSVSLESLISIASESNASRIPLPKTTSKPFNPFPRTYINRHRAINGMKLGLYKPSVYPEVNQNQEPSLQKNLSKS